MEFNGGLNLYLDFSTQRYDVKVRGLAILTRRPFESHTISDVN
jgi:hypothetical protein